MSPRLYNTLTKTKETFVPLDEKNVRMYVCGPTVYDYAHIGNARPVIVFDVLFRLLRHLYGDKHVTYVRNITDVDDKIIAAAKENNETIEAITTRTAKQFHEDVAALGCLQPTHEPRATAHVGQMIAMIEKLIVAGHAYAAEGHVLYDVSSKEDYGKLARRSLDEMMAGARVEVAPYKKNPMDFVLWKPAKAGEPGWDSPWGKGRPGWHIECSAMSGALLGETFDIHGGGIDLTFPHHENEIAQSEGAHNGHSLARVWMHNGFLQVEGQKMSKSLGNFVTIRDLREHWQGEVIRLAMLMTHYRQPINWTKSGLADARSVWLELAYEARDVHPDSVSPELIACIEDDLNTPSAISHLHELKHQARSGSLEAARSLSASLLFLGLIKPQFPYADFVGYLRVTGTASVIIGELLSQTNGDVFVRQLIDAVEVWAEKNDKKVDEKVFSIGRKISPHMLIRDVRGVDFIEVSNEIDARLTARKARDFKEADRIRDELAEKGIVLKDNADGTTTWEVKR